MTEFATGGVIKPIRPTPLPGYPPEGLPGVVTERWNAYQAAKSVAPRDALPNDILALAVFLGAIDRELEPEPDLGEVGDGDIEDDLPGCLNDSGGCDCTLHAEDDETPGFTPAEGGDEWPPVRLAGETWPRWERRVYALFRAGKAPEEYYQ